MRAGPDPLLKGVSKSPYEAAEAMPLLARPLEGTALIPMALRPRKRARVLPRKGNLS